MSICKKNLAILLIITITIYAFSEPAAKAKKVFTILLNDKTGSEIWLPDIGEKPILLIYEDFRNIGNNRELYKTITGDKFIASKIKIIYILNIVPAWHTPEFLIAHSFKKVESIYPGISHLLDRNKDLQIKWRLLDSNKKSVIILINKNSEIINLQYDIPDKRDLNSIKEIIRGMSKN